MLGRAMHAKQQGQQARDYEKANGLTESRVRASNTTKISGEGYVHNGIEYSPESVEFEMGLVPNCCEQVGSDVTTFFTTDPGNISISGIDVALDKQVEIKTTFIYEPKIGTESWCLNCASRDHITKTIKFPDKFVYDLISN
jgi:hypothetical protein